MTRVAQEHTFTAVDCAEIFYRHWPSQQKNENKRAIILFHRGHEHSGRQQDVVVVVFQPEHLGETIKIPGRIRGRHRPCAIRT